MDDSKFRGRATQRTTLLVPLCLALLSGQPAWSADPVQLKHFNIAAGDAVLRLNEFSRQANMQVLFDFRQLKPFQTQAVSGDFEPAQALTMMLAGGCLEFTFVNNLTVAVSPGKSDCVPTAKPSP
jgi:hypothetical protein